MKFTINVPDHELVAFMKSIGNTDIILSRHPNPLFSIYDVRDVARDNEMKAVLTDDQCADVLKEALECEGLTEQININILAALENYEL